MLTIFFLIRAKKLSSQQGFTMLEVLVAILITTAFIATSLQLMVINAVYKVRGQIKAQALFWVQEDQEKIIALADTNNIPYDSSAQCTSTTDSYSIRLWKRLEPDSSSSFPANTDSTLLLNDTGTNDSVANFTLQKPLIGTLKNYQLQRTYKIKTSDPQILLMSYKVVDPEKSDSDANKIIVKTNYEVKPNAYYQCP